MESLTAISPLDGRYHQVLKGLSVYSSEYALIYQRLYIEIAYLKALAQINILTLSNTDLATLDSIITDFDMHKAQEVKTFEAKTNHDVKAVEYYLKAQMDSSDSLKAAKEFVHFGLTSEDVNNLAYTLMMKNFLEYETLPQLEKLINALSSLAKDNKAQPMLSRTHGQPASPTTLGKEIWVFVMRLNRQVHGLKNQDMLGKLGGAVGNFNAHVVAYPDVDWQSFAKSFVESLGLQYNSITTQIEAHDFMAETFDTVRRINTILIDLCRDCWQYISLGYFSQKLKSGEVGSSTMPHKVNPIDFENAEGNLGLSSALCSHLSQKLPISRMQRDLSDSTVLRNVGTTLSYQALALSSLLKGLNKLEVNTETLDADLAAHPEVLGEALQTVMRRFGIDKPYEKLKNLTRGKALTLDTLATFIDTLAIPEDEKTRLKGLSPAMYIGLADKLVD